MKLNNITKYYEDKRIFDDFNFECSDKDFVVVVGKSGVGKTTLLNIVAGLSDFEGDINGVGKVSYMFQDDVLIDSLSIIDNLSLVLNKPKECILDYLRKFDILDSAYKKPSELSGGIARRVSLIRALYFEADTYLLDEPTKSLDKRNKNMVVKNIEDNYKNNPHLTICVTHELEDFENLATKIICL